MAASDYVSETLGFTLALKGASTDGKRTLLDVRSSMGNACCSRMEYDLARVCEQHADRHDCPDALVAEVRGGFGLMIHDGGSSVIEIAHCPWCGAKLPPIGDLDLD